MPTEHFSVSDPLGSLGGGGDGEGGPPEAGFQYDKDDESADDAPVYLDSDDVADVVDGTKFHLRVRAKTP